jgi:hypothetical protein
MEWPCREHAAEVECGESSVHGKSHAWFYPLISCFEICMLMLHQIFVAFAAIGPNESKKRVKHAQDFPWMGERHFLAEMWDLLD